MLRKLSVSLLSILLLLQFAVPALAVEGDDQATSFTADVSVISDYFLDNTLFCFLNMTSKSKGFDASDIAAGVHAGGVSVSNSFTPAKVAPAANTVSYLLLVDASDSMPQYSEQVRSFAKNLKRAEKLTTKISVATFGNEFKVLAEDLTDANKIDQALRGISYNQTASDICGGAKAGVNYLSNHKREAGELVHLIVLTDGETYLSGSGSSKSEIAASAASLKSTIAASPEVIVHSVRFGDKGWESETKKALDSGAGKNLSINAAGVNGAGNQIVSFTDGLYALAFPLYGTFDRTMSGQLALTYTETDSTQFIPLSNIKNMDATGFAAATEIGPEKPADPSPETAAPEALAPEGAAPGTDAPAGEAPAEETPGETEPGGTDPAREEEPESGSGSGSSGSVGGGVVDASPAVNDTQEEKTEETETARSSGSSRSGPPIWLWILLAVLVVLALAVAGLRIFRANAGGSAPVAAAGTAYVPPSHGPRVVFQFLSGERNGTEQVYSLERDLILGSDPTCGAVFADSSLSAQNSRIFIRNGQVYIDDLNTDSNTTVSGMKIYAPNQLRDGDDVTIGRVHFRVRFIDIA